MATKGNKAVKAAEPAAVEVGNFVTFLGYGADVPEKERMLEKDSAYEVIELTDGGYVVKFDNPDFDDKKKVDAKNNPATLETEVFTNEVALAATPADAVAAPVAKATKIKAGKTPKVPAPAVTKEKVVKEKVAKAPKEPKAPKVKADPDALPDLTAEQEDADVLAIVNESEDLVATAQDLEGNIGKNEYHLGGVLFHIKKSKSYQALNEAYKENAGFAAFTKDYLNIDYRKAMTLIDIYVTFSQLGVENPADRVAAIGWSKAAKITKPMQEEGAKVEDLLQLAEENSSVDLSIAIKEQTTHVGSTKGEPVKRVTVKFRFFEETGTSIMAIIHAAKAQQSLATDEEALAFILDDWSLTNGGAATQAEAPKQAAPVTTAKPRGSAKPQAKVAA